MLCALLLLVAARPSEAITLRYAVVIGNDRSGAAPLPPLAHAEREAGRLAGALRKYAAFVPSRLILLEGPTRAGVKSAVERLARRKARDLKSLPGANTLFGLFFTGHGLEGQVLLRDAPLTGADIGTLFRRMDADFSLGVFDACYSGSLEAGVLGKGGITPLPGLDLFDTLPTDVLTAKGSMWFVSSGPRQLSFEDAKLGGVFTHFFIRALRHASRDGPGITLDRIWDYAQSRTVRFTAARRLVQKPRMVTQVSGEAFPTFSFPIPRSARLTFGRGVAGSFVLSYAAGSLVHVIDKPPNTRKTVAVYPGEARLLRMDKGRAAAERTLTLGPDPITIRSLSDRAPPAGPMGRSNQSLWRRKGAFGAQTLHASVLADAPSVHLGLGYAVAPLSARLLTARHIGGLVVRFDRGGLTATARLAYGYARQDFDAWGFTLHALVGDARAGWAWNLGPVRLGVGAGLEVDGLWQSFRDESTRRTWGIQPAAHLSVIVPSTAAVKAAITVSGGARYAPGVAILDDAGWAPALSVSLDLLVGLL